MCVFTYMGTKVGTCFNLIDQTKFKHKNDIIYHGKSPVEECPDNYIGETKRRMSERISDHNGRDISSYPETSPLICNANHLNGFYKMLACVMKELKELLIIV